MWSLRIDGCERIRISLRKKKITKNLIFHICIWRSETLPNLMHLEPSMHNTHITIQNFNTNSKYAKLGLCKARKARVRKTYCLWVSTRYNSRDIHHTRIALYNTRGIGLYTYLSACITPCTVRIAPCTFRTLHTLIIVGLFIQIAPTAQLLVSLRAVRSSSI